MIAGDLKSAALMRDRLSQGRSAQPSAQRGRVGLRAVWTWVLPLPPKTFGPASNQSCARPRQARPQKGVHPVVGLCQGSGVMALGAGQYVLASDLNTESRDATSPWDSLDSTVRIGPETEEEAFVCGGRLVFDDANMAVLTGALPPLVLVRAAEARGKQLAHLRELMVAEVESNEAGGSLLLSHIAQILLVLMLRAHASQVREPAGWLGALNEDGIGAALRAMQTDVVHAWTLKEVADVSQMSRSAFAQSLKDQVGTPPLEYLIQWRMSLARDALTHDTSSIFEIAHAVGYKSPNAFSVAFRRVVGTSPKKFRDEARRSLSSSRTDRDRPGAIPLEPLPAHIPTSTRRPGYRRRLGEVNSDIARRCP